jgi:hypothetical protein
MSLFYFIFGTYLNLLYMASLNNLLSRASGYQSELDEIQMNLEVLSKIAQAILTDGFTEVEMILETHPKNGAPAHVVPLFAAGTFPIGGMINTTDPIPNPPQIGFQRFYLPDEHEDNLMTASISLEANIALSIIDRAIQRLKARRFIILKNSKKILKAD